ncbi:GntR family transcriptional regulator [Actinophytocola sp.]|uniref:GntR family transcriptional regulator n=1 Tax=Actinophytocola sp. TaxID=1872138 RepID=UPI003D6ABAEE
MTRADHQGGPPTSKTAYVLRRLRDEIADGFFHTGQPLRQVDLASRYGVSPTPVREALRLLEAEGLISYSPHRGATVTEMDAQSVQDLYRLRAAMESHATRVAAERFADDSGERLLKLHRQLARARTKLAGAELSRLNKELHFAIYESGSLIIAEHIHSLWRLIPPAVTLWSRAEFTKVLVPQHGEVITAVLDRDPDAAADLMSEHVLTAARFREELQAR